MLPFARDSISPAFLTQIIPTSEMATGFFSFSRLPSADIRSVEQVRLKGSFDTGSRVMSVFFIVAYNFPGALS